MAYHLYSVFIHQILKAIHTFNLIHPQMMQHVKEPGVQYLAQRHLDMVAIAGD